LAHVISRSNPRENIRNTVDMKYVMKRGKLYDAMSLDDVWRKTTRSARTTG
jgi:hypothetical protein